MVAVQRSSTGLAAAFITRCIGRSFTAGNKDHIAVIESSQDERRCEIRCDVTAKLPPSVARTSEMIEAYLCRPLNVVAHTNDWLIVTFVC